MPIVVSKKRNSILGSIALLLAFGAVAISVFDVAGLPPVNVGPMNLPFAVAFDAGVGALALIALLLAGKSIRTGTEIPGAALVVVLLAGGAYYIRHKTPPAPPVVAHPAPPAQPPVVTQAPPKPANAPVRPIVPSVSTAADAAKSAAGKAATALTRQQQVAAIQDAKAKYAAAQTRVMATMKTDPAYLKAKARYDAADLHLKDARLSYPAGDPNLVSVSQTALQAKDALNQFIADAVAKDPDAAAAKAKLDALTPPNP